MTNTSSLIEKFFEDVQGLLDTETYREEFNRLIPSPKDLTCVCA